MDNMKRYRNVLRKMDLQDEESICDALKKKGTFKESDVFPLSSLQFELTSHCNAFCRHCYNNSGANKTPDAMTPEKWIEFSKYLVAHGGVFECLLSGGEPLLLGNSLYDIMDILHDDGTIFFLITNGYLLTEDVAKRLSGYLYHSLQISIDSSTAEYHDLFRCLKGGWKRAIRAAESVSSNGIPLKIAHCVTPYNINKIDDMCDLAYSLGAKSVMIGEICLSGRTANNMDLLLNEHERILLMEKVKENGERYKGRMRVKSSHSVKEGLEKQAEWPDSCALIRPNGDIRIDGMAPFVIGNILKDDFESVWRKKIGSCWQNPSVKKFIHSFDSDDRNRVFINYQNDDVYL